MPRLADGVELIGEMEGSGFKEAPYLARRADGQVIQLPQLLYLVAEASDGTRGYGEIAEHVSEQFGRGLDEEGVELLVDKKLRPLGVLADADGSSPALPKADPLLALKLKTAAVPESVVNAIAALFSPLFFPPVVLAVLGGLVAVDIWLFAFHGVAQGLRSALYNPAFMLLVLALVVLSAAFHECGHAAACRYGGARPGVMGVGLYLVWPAFYTDVTDAYRLGKGGRLRTDLGGVYFNAIFILLTVGAYLLTGFEPLLLIVPLQHMEIVHQFLPFIRLDGYYIVADLTGVPDMFSRIRPTLTSLLPWKEADPRVTELKPWVRVAVTVYVLAVVPLLLFLFALTVINVPRILSTAWDSFLVQWDKLGEGGAAMTAYHAFEMLVLLLPVGGIAAMFWTLGRKILVGGWRGTTGRPLARGAFVTATAAALAGAGWVWYPNGEYRPIQPGERGTIQGGVEQIAAVETGRPALTRERRKDLAGAPTQHSRAAPASPGDKSRTGGTTTGSTETTPTDTASTSTTDTTASTTTETTPTTTTETTDTTTTDTTTTATTTTTTTTATTP